MRIKYDEKMGVRGNGRHQGRCQIFIEGLFFRGLMLVIISIGVINPFWGHLFVLFLRPRVVFYDGT